MDESEGKKKAREDREGCLGDRERLSILEITCKVSCYFHWATELFRITIEPAHGRADHRGGSRCRVAQDLLNPCLFAGFLLARKISFPVPIGRRE